MKGLLPNHGTEFLSISRDVFNGQVDAKSTGYCDGFLRTIYFVKQCAKKWILAKLVFEGDEFTHGNSLVRNQENLRKESLTIEINTFDELTAIDSFVYHITTSRVSGCPGKPQDEPLSKP